MDQNFTPVAEGVEGELYIGGDIVNSGYLKQEELTKTAFLENPFCSSEDRISGHDRLYKTGDAVKLLPGGEYSINGRINGDRQVKIRGMRTELNEIEDSIHDAFSGIEHSMCSLFMAAVVYHDNDPLDCVLAAYLTIQESDTAADLRTDELVSQLRLYLTARLPAHMVPSSFIVMPELPQTASGKWDYKTMRSWPVPRLDMTKHNHGEGDATKLTELRTTLAGIWKRVLKTNAEPSQRDEFFAFGGHSLLLLPIQTEILQHFAVKVPIVDLFSNPTFQGFLELISKSVSSGRAHLNESDSQGSYQPKDSCTEQGGDNVIVTTQDTVNWYSEGSLALLNARPSGTTSTTSRSIVALTGASTMAGCHFIAYVLKTT